MPLNQDSCVDLFLRVRWTSSSFCAFKLGARLGQAPDSWVVGGKDKLRNVVLHKRQILALDLPWLWGKTRASSRFVCGWTSQNLVTRPGQAPYSCVARTYVRGKLGGRHPQPMCIRGALRAAEQRGIFAGRSPGVPLHAAANGECW